MLLVTGALGSGKTSYVLDQVRGLLREGEKGLRLLVPTATMAGHLRHQMAREGFVFQPGQIQTFTSFLAPWSDGPAQISRAALPRLVKEALDLAAPEEFEKAASLEGFSSYLATLAEEFSLTGCPASRLEKALADEPGRAAYARAFLAVYTALERLLERRGLCLRGAALARAAECIRRLGVAGIQRIFIDGFLSFTAPELAVVQALARHADLAVTLPEWRGARAAREELLASGFRLLEVGTRKRARPRQVLAPAPTVPQEAEEVARRILEQAASGRPFREMGIVVRSQEDYGPVLRSTLERFGIPARFYFGEPLDATAPVRYLTTAVEAMLSGWDWEQLLPLFAMYPSGLGATPEGDRLDFEMREKLPCKGLEALRARLHSRRAQDLLDRLTELEGLRSGRAPAAQWAERAKLLRSLFSAPRPLEAPSHEMVHVWRTDAAALQAFEGVLEETGQLLAERGPLTFSEFWEEAKGVLRDTALRVPDRRRNAVHVMDVYEARQWELPVVFVCGMLEKQFPRYAPQDAVFPDPLRRRLSERGVRLRTTEDLEEEERFLFDLATSRATELLVLSFPRQDRSGQENLPSFFLDSFRTWAECAPARPVRPQPLLPPPESPPPAIRDERLQEERLGLHSRLAPTAIESFLQCPFQFFARYTLALAGWPLRPEERLSPLVEGSILHSVLAQLDEGEEPFRLFESVFEEICRRERIPRGYRTEVHRLELLRSLAGFLSEDGPALGGRTLTEISFELPLSDSLLVSGRMDRLDLDESGRRALVADYKYSSEASIRKLVKNTEAGILVQAGLYMLAARSLGYEPAGMLFCGLRRGAHWNGWHAALPGLGRLGAVCTEEVLAELMEQAKTLSLKAASQIRAGVIAPLPADPEKCEYCEYCDICRVETAAPAVAAAGGGAELP